MKITHVLFAAMVATTIACSSSEKETPNGFKYTVIAKGDGNLAKPGQLLLVDFTFKDSKDSVWNDTYKAGMPAPVMINDSAKIAEEIGIMQMFRLLSPGDSVTCSMPIKKFFADMAGGPVPPNVDSTLTMTYIFKVKEITEVANYQAAQAKVAEEKSAKQLQSDIEAIDKFLTEKGIAAEKMENGIRYVMSKAGKGENAKSQQNVKVNYAGYTMEGVYFDSNIKTIAQEKGVYNPGREPYGPMDVTIDQSGVITGWHEALKVLNKGAKATFYIPSTLGWGPNRVSEVIKENQITVFDIEVLEIK
jgi:FKBP-type peptidyl-prolyl cis-trans isomerase FkpA